MDETTLCDEVQVRLEDSPEVSQEEIDEVLEILGNDEMNCLIDAKWAMEDAGVRREDRITILDDLRD